jgi:hypothetical protein
MKKLNKVLKTRLEELIDKKGKKNGINYEFQDYGFRLAHRLGDLERKTLYIKLAKQVPRPLIEDAAIFASYYNHVPNKGKIFMWKLYALIDEYKEEHPDFKIDYSRSKTKARQKKSKSQTESKKKKPTKNYKLFGS